MQTENQSQYPLVVHTVLNGLIFDLRLASDLGESLR